MGRLEVETYEDGETIRYAYDNSGNLATVTDSATGVVTTYYYDLLNRQSGYREQGAKGQGTVLCLAVTDTQAQVIIEKNIALQHNHRVSKP